MNTLHIFALQRYDVLHLFMNVCRANGIPFELHILPDARIEQQDRVIELKPYQVLCRFEKDDGDRVLDWKEAIRMIEYLDPVVFVQSGTSKRKR